MGKRSSDIILDFVMILKLHNHCEDDRVPNGQILCHGSSLYAGGAAASASSAPDAETFTTDYDDG